jgi:aldehyde dehydrogenase (NAD+)
LVANQREFFKTGKPAELEHRKEQLKRLRQVILQNREELCHAVYLDLKRPAKINWTLELASVIVEIDYMLENLEVF